MQQHWHHHIVLGFFFEKPTSSSSSWRTPVRALPYWWLFARCPYPWPSSRQCKLQVLGLDILSQVVLGRPAGLLQSAGGRSTAAMMRWWSSAGAVRARWPKNLRRWDLTTSETGVQAVMSRTVLFVVCLVYGIRKNFGRHQVSDASKTHCRAK